jgi:hypothetical protein
MHAPNKAPSKNLECQYVEMTGLEAARITASGRVRQCTTAIGDITARLVVAGTSRSPATAIDL